MKQAWRTSEIRTAKRLGMKLTAGSGNLHDKGDMRDEQYRLEHKSTDKPFLNLKREWLIKIALQALATGRNPAFSFEMLGYGMWSMAPLSRDPDWPERRLFFPSDRQSLRLTSFELEKKSLKGQRAIYLVDDLTGKVWGLLKEGRRGRGQS